MLAEAGVPIEPLVDRDALLRELFPEAAAADRGRLDLAFSRLKLDLRVTADDVAATRPRAPSRARSSPTSGRSRSSAASTSTTSSSARSGSSRPMGACWPRWRGRCARLLVDEAQDLDRTQLSSRCCSRRPANDVFLVGDDDQSIYGWRLADVRRVLGLAASLPGLRRVDLETNYRCPRPVVERAVRLVEHNRERFAKRIVPGPNGRRAGWSSRPTRADDLVRVTRAMRTWPEDASTRAILARTNRELLVAVVAALDLGIPFRAPELPLPIEDDRIDGLLDRAVAAGVGAVGRVAAARARTAAADAARGSRRERRGPGDARRRGWPDAGRPGRLDARLGGAAAHARGAAVRDRGARQRLAELRRDDAALTLATAHGTKGLEWDHVSCSPTGSPGAGRSRTRRSRSARSRRSAGWRTSRGPARGAR